MENEFGYIYMFRTETNMNHAYYLLRTKQAFFILFLYVFTASCTQKNKPVDKGEPADLHSRDSFFQEAFRPQFHFSPKDNWMNDPNGMVYHKGIYHLFFQYYPEDIVWGPMHWGHATSKDLVFWEHQPIKLFPDENGYIFSGSAVVDHKNTSGLGSAENPPLVAIFTYHDPIGEKEERIDFQTQGIAFSLDNGKSWTKYKNNPVLMNPGIADFRDPKVFWHKETKKWIMALAVKDHAEFYASPDLINWSKLSEFGKISGAHGGVWECPDLFPLVVEGSDILKWVLIISINPGGPNAGSATQYFVGDFDGKTFAADHSDIKWMDYGSDNYAGVTYSNVPDGKKILIGWMSNWNYAQKTPTKEWRSAMTLPRELSLIREQDQYWLRSMPIENFDKLSKNIRQIASLDLESTYKLVDQQIQQSDIKFNTSLSENLSLKFHNDIDEELVFSIDAQTNQIILDRRKSGKTDFSDNFADKIHTLPFSDLEKKVDARIIIDRSSIEIFVDEGKYVLTEQFFPNAPYNSIEISSSTNGVITDLNINYIKSIWNNE